MKVFGADRQSVRGGWSGKAFSAAAAKSNRVCRPAVIAEADELTLASADWVPRKCGVGTVASGASFQRIRGTFSIRNCPCRRHP
ncbi:MAG TPA: hypothetical protein DIT89_10495 [Planctomycetaceae bacterium]|nr:hypothetical protein [Planctomycetaceae bacterium]